MSVLETFLLARFDEEEKDVKERNSNRPIHYAGCYYYSNTLDSGYYCDCDEDGPNEEVVILPLAQIQARRDVVACMTGPERDLLVAILVKPYVHHPDYPKLA